MHKMGELYAGELTNEEREEMARHLPPLYYRLAMFSLCMEAVDGPRHYILSFPAMLHEVWGLPLLETLEPAELITTIRLAPFDNTKALEVYMTAEDEEKPIKGYVERHSNSADDGEPDGCTDECVNKQTRYNGHVAQPQVRKNRRAGWQVREMNRLVATHHMSEEDVGRPGTQRRWDTWMGIRDTMAGR